MALTASEKNKRYRERLKRERAAKGETVPASRPRPVRPVGVVVERDPKTLFSIREREMSAREAVAALERERAEPSQNSFAVIAACKAILDRVAKQERLELDRERFAFQQAQAESKAGDGDDADDDVSAFGPAAFPKSERGDHDA